MKLVIKDDSVFSKDDGTAPNARGGTELMLAGLKKHADQELLNQFQIICSRVRNIDPDKHLILWLHDLVGDPEAAHLKDPKSRERFAKLVFVSNYQFSSYHLGLGVPYSSSIVLRNAIEPVALDLSHKKWINELKPDPTIRLVYHTTPHRGLEILVPVFAVLAKDNPNIHLDVYSSFDIYGWSDRDKPYEQIFNMCREHPQITYHGAVENSVVREALKTADIFAFPSIWPETSCIAAIEAMSAGCLVVCPDYAGLAETVGDFGFTYRFDERPMVHANRFASVLNMAIERVNTDFMNNLLATAQSRANVAYNWEYRKDEWNRLFEIVLAEVSQPAANAGPV